MTYKHIKILIFRERKKMKKKEEAKEKEGGENSVKQGREKLEPRWKGRKNREIREGKIGS